MKIGVMELIVIFVVALLVIGPDRLPEYARKLGAALGEFRKASADLTSDIREGVVEPLEQAQEPLRQAVEPLDDLKREVRGEWKEVETSLNDLSKPQKAARAAPVSPQPEPTAEPAVGEPIREGEHLS